MSRLQDILLGTRGGAGGVGHRSASAALAAGYSPSDIKAAMGSQAIKDANVAAGVAATNEGVISDLSATGPTSSWGTHGADSSGSWANVGDAREAHVGAADVNFMRHQGMTFGEIQDYMGGESSPGVSRTNPNHPSSEAGGTTDYSRMLGAINTLTRVEDAEATNTANTRRIGSLNTAYTNLSGQYSTLQNKYDALGKSYTGLQADVAQAAKDAMKIKYTGSTAVQNPSAMGIQAAQGTPFRGSGMAGAAALARPNKGLKIKTLNV